MRLPTAFASVLLPGILCSMALTAGEPTPPPPDPKQKPTRPTPPPAPVVLPTRPAPIRIKDLAEFQGVRENQIIGNGLVVGLDGTGDQSSKLASQELANLTTRFGVRINVNDLKSKNIAAVLITAKLPPFVRKGASIDVQVSSVGDAKSLEGGILLQTPLVGADGRVYAVAQGAVSVGGFSAGGSGAGGAQVRKNHPLVGRIPDGALIEREVPSQIAASGALRLRLRKPDFTTAQRVVDAINVRWPGIAHAADLSCIDVRIPEKVLAKRAHVHFISRLEGLSVTPDCEARVVINERTGTVVAGASVRIAPTAVSHGNLFITVKSVVGVSQPLPYTDGQTVAFSDQSTVATEQEGQVMVLAHGPTLSDLARALNALKVSPRDIIAIFQALKNAGALHAKLIIM